MKALPEDQKALINAGYSGRIEGLVEDEALHNCPICGEVAECYCTASDYHSCKWCGSTWHTG